MDSYEMERTLRWTAAFAVTGLAQTVVALLRMFCFGLEWFQLARAAVYFFVAFLLYCRARAKQASGPTDGEDSGKTEPPALHRSGGL